MHLLWVGRHCEGDQERASVLCAAESSMQVVRVCTCILRGPGCLYLAYGCISSGRYLQPPGQAKKHFLKPEAVLMMVPRCVCVCQLVYPDVQLACWGAGLQFPPGLCLGCLQY